jgi:hypothetical protein
MTEEKENFEPLFGKLEESKSNGWVLLSESELNLLNEIRDIRELILEIEAPDYNISSIT